MTEYVYKLKNGKLVSAYADEKGNIAITKEALEIMTNSWDDGYQKGYSDGCIKGRAEAIEECINDLIREHEIWINLGVREYASGVRLCIEDLFKLKEQK